MPRESIAVLKDKLAKLEADATLLRAENASLRAANYLAVTRASTHEVVSKSLRDERDGLTQALIESRKSAR